MGELQPPDDDSRGSPCGYDRMAVLAPNNDGFRTRRLAHAALLPVVDLVVPGPTPTPGVISPRYVHALSGCVPRPSH